MKKGHFEAKKHSYRQTQDGIVISFVVHPDDVSSELALAPLGTMYMIGFAKIEEAGKPVYDALNFEAFNGENVEKEKKRRQFETLQPSAQAAILCNDPEFETFLLDTGIQHPLGESWSLADEVRYRCKVESRSQFNTDAKALNRWQVLKGQFKQFQTDRRYAEAAH